jgi:hypothetical protein
MDTTYLHIGMILSTLGLNPHGFALGLYSKDLMSMEIFVYPYIPMILPISSQCGTLVVYPTEKRLENHYQDIGLPAEQRLTTVLSRDSLKRVERWSGRGSVDLVVLRSSLPDKSSGLT